ncbi:MAG: citrate synthase/methylcitrate synthase [Steroidobacteraceae bacterium]
MVYGLEGVVAAETVLSDVDGQAGRLIIRGRSLDELAGGSRYEDVLALLWAELISECPDARTLAAGLGAARVRVFHHVRALDEPLLALPTFDTALSLLTRIEDGDDLTTALNLLAAPAVFTPAAIRLRRGLDPVPPDPKLAHAADLLRMLRGTQPHAAQVSALDRYLVTASDHGLNASTFTARVIASTHAGLAAAVIGASCALKGPLHGGAPGPILDMLDAIGHPDRARAWLEAALSRGERLMGFGHRVYRVRDPRADALKVALQLLAQTGQLDVERLRLAEAVEGAALELLARRKPERRLQTNLEFYTALLLEALGFPRDAFTCVFAASRAGGWIAHAREQILRGRLIRPQSRYVGPRAEAVVSR